MTTASGSVRCRSLELQLETEHARARVSISLGDEGPLLEVLDKLERARLNVESEMGADHVRFPIRGPVKLELEMSEEITPQELADLEARLEAIGRAALGQASGADSEPESMVEAHHATSAPASNIVPVSAPSESTSPLFACRSLADTLRFMHEELARRSRSFPGSHGELIFHSRIGLLEPHRTLEQLGGRIDLTRERIRQIEARTVEEMRSDSVIGPFLQQLGAELRRRIREGVSKAPHEKLFAGSQCPLACLRVDESTAGKRKGIDEMAALRRFIDFFLLQEDDRPAFELVEIEEGGSAIFEAVEAEEYQAAQADMLDFLEARKREGLLHAGDILPAIGERLAAKPRAVADRMRVLFMTDFNWSVDEPWRHESAVLASRGKAIGAVVAAVLERSESRLSKQALIDHCRKAPWKLKQGKGSIVNEVFKLTADPTNRDRDDVYVPVFQLSRGYYGTARHLPIDVTDMAEDAEIVADLIVDGRSTPDPEMPYQWHCVDLVDELLERGQCSWLQDIEAEARWPLLDCLLRYHAPERVVNLTKGFWVAHQPGLEESEHERRDQNELVVQVLRTASRPMTLNELASEVEKYQSLGAQRQLQCRNEPKPPIVRDEESRYGLEDW